MDGLFITGTDTGVGKTFVSSIILRALRDSPDRIGAFKPVCSGGEVNADGEMRWQDVDTLAAAADVDSGEVCPLCFSYPAAPPVAAAHEGKRVDLAVINSALASWQSRADRLVIEGVGGFLCPLTESETLADWVEGLRVPVLVVVDNRLGAINHALLTIEAIRARKLEVAGVVMNDVSPDVDRLVAQTNSEQIANYGNVSILRHVPHNSSNLCLSQSDSRMDWASLFGPVDFAPR